MTGCGCFGVVALIAAFVYFLVRGSFDSGEPVDS